MTTTATPGFTLGDTAEILEAAGWDVWNLGAGRGYSVGDDAGNRVQLTRAENGQILVHMELATEHAPYDADARMAIDERAGALCIARMILAAVQGDDD